MIKAIIIDDEQSCIDSLQYDLQKNCPEVQIVEACLSPKEGLLTIRRHQPDLVFLDVQMPWMNGFEMLDILQQINFAVIFTTAFDHFAAHAFRISAVDYLLKPIDVNDLKEAVQKTARQIALKAGSAHIDNLLQNIKKPNTQQRIAFADREGYEFVEMENIVFAKAEGAYTHVFLQDKRKLVLSKTLSDVEELLASASFQRIHHSALINLSHVTHFVKADGGYVVMDTGEKMIVSKSKKAVLMERLGIK